METPNRTSCVLFVGVTLFPLIAIALLATAIYAECNQKIPVNIECQTNLPTDNCTGTQLTCHKQKKLLQVYENNFGRKADPESNEHTVHTGEKKDEQKCYKYNTCKWVAFTGCKPDEEKNQKAPIYVGTHCP